MTSQFKNSGYGGNGAAPHKREKTLLEIVQIILRNKKILVISLIFFIATALIYSFITQPKYDAVAILKKERTGEEGRISGPNLSNLLNLQSLDEIETEIQLVTTYSVLSKVVDELDLFCLIDKINWGNSESYKINLNYIDMKDESFIKKTERKFIIPRHFEVFISDTTISSDGSYYISKSSENEFNLFDAKDDRLLVKSKIDSLSNSDSIKSSSNKSYYVLETRNFKVLLSWEEAPLSSRIYFKFQDIPQTIVNVNKNTTVSREGKTDIFTVSYIAPSAFSAALITNTIVDKYRESRLSQKKETIRYSFDFVDKQLNEVQEKLKTSEAELSSFKATGQIMSIDASSQELMSFLSNLEAEKYNTDLQLSDLKNRAADLEKELKQTGYFDQNYLNPQGSMDANSPFSQLMRQLADLELQRLELLQKRTENHPDVIALDQQIELTKSKLASFNENTITAYKIMINTLEKKLLKINDLMSKYEVKMRSLPSQENKLAQLLRQRGTYERIFTILLDQREAMRVAELSKMQDITVVDAAKPPIKPFFPNKTLILIVSIILGSLVGLIGIFLVEYRMSRYINLDELESEFQTPILSIIPKYNKETTKILQLSKDHKIATLITQDTGLIETYRLFRTKLLHRLNPESKVIMITSCEEDSGKTSVTGNLAVSLAQDGKKVLLVDCDLRKADLSKMFGLSVSEPGLIDYLTKDTNPKIYSRASKNIDILPAGGIREDSGTLLNSSRMKLLFNHLINSNYDIIIFDTPPVTRVVDPLVMASFIKDVILVVKPKHSLIETVRWGIQELKQTKVRVIGIVANAAEIENSYYYRYRYGYGYGYSGKQEKNPSKFKSLVAGSKSFSKTIK